MISFKDYISKKLILIEAAQNMPYTETELEKLYEKFNAMLFYDELEYIPISYNNTKKEMGQFKYRYNRQERCFEPEEIFITSIYELNKRQIEAILIHEMIHYWEMLNYPNEFRRTAHGRMFVQKVEEVNKILKSKNEDITVSVIFPDIVSKFEKETCSVFIFDYRGKHAFIKCSPKSISKIGSGIIENIRQFKGKSISNPYLVESTDDSYFNVFSASRVLKSFYYFDKPEGKEAYERIMKIAKKVDLDNPRFNVRDKIFA